MRHSSIVGAAGAAALCLALAACGGDAGRSDDTGLATADTQGAQVSADDRDDAVERALDADSTLRVYGLDADDDDDRIVLKGVVRTAAERDRAQQVASREAAGVTVENRIRVDANRRVDARPEDVDEVEDRVEDAIEADSTFRGLDIDVDEDGGRIVLEGSVRTAAQRSAAEELARRLAGSVAVENRLRVQP